MYYSPCKDVQACNYTSETSEGDRAQTQMKNSPFSKQHNRPCVPRVGAGENLIHCSDFGPSSQKCASSSEGTESVTFPKHTCITALYLQSNPKAFSRLNILLLRYCSVYDQWRAEGHKSPALCLHHRGADETRRKWNPLSDKF